MAGWAVVAGGVACTLLLGLGLRWIGSDYVLHLLDWLQAIGIWGPVVLVLIEIVVVMLLLPGLPFTIGAGFLFGPLLGTVCVVGGNTLGGALALLTARRLLGKRTTRFLRRWPQLCDLE